MVSLALNHRLISETPTGVGKPHSHSIDEWPEFATSPFTLPPLRLCALASLRCPPPSCVEGTGRNARPTGIVFLAARLSGLGQIETLLVKSLLDKIVEKRFDSFFQ